MTRRVASSQDLVVASHLDPQLSLQILNLSKIESLLRIYRLNSDLSFNMIPSMPLMLVLHILDLLVLSLHLLYQSLQRSLQHLISLRHHFALSQSLSRLPQARHLPQSQIPLLPQSILLSTQLTLILHGSLHVLLLNRHSTISFLLVSFVLLCHSI